MYRTLFGMIAMACILMATGAAPSAHAGEWVAQHEWQGTSSGYRSNLPNGPNQPAQIVDTVVFDWASNLYTDPSVSDNLARASRGGVYTSSEKGAGEAKFQNGQVRIVWQWQSSTNEPVPPFIVFQVNASVGAEANNRKTSTGHDATGVSGNAGVTLEGATIVPGSASDAVSSRWFAQGTRLIWQATNGQARLVGPVVGLSAKATIPDNRTTLFYAGPPGTNFPSAWVASPNSGFTQVFGSVSATMLGNFAPTLPNPDGLAVAPWPDPTPLKPLNQYVMSGGEQGPFTIPCVVTYDGSDSSFYYQLVNGLNWTIARAPSAMIPRVSNGSSTTNGITSLFPQHVPATPTPPPAVSGLAFENVLPASNGAFGINSITHTFQGTTLATSSFALFFDPMDRTHPIGGPTWVSGRTSGVPNFIYYYNQAWQNPWGIEVRFRNSRGSSYLRGEQFVETGTDSHGLSNSAPNGGMDADGGIDTDMFAKNPTNQKLIWVGYQRIRGLDLYARNVYHECVHKRLYDSVQSGALDSDVDSLTNLPSPDGLPESIENQIGTDPLSTNSVPWKIPYATGTEDVSDNETFARMCERDLPVPNDDWAIDGFNFGRPAAPNRYQHVVEWFWPGFNRNNTQWVDARYLVP